MNGSIRIFHALVVFAENSLTDLMIEGAPYDYVSLEGDADDTCCPAIGFLACESDEGSARDLVERHVLEEYPAAKVRRALLTDVTSRAAAIISKGCVAKEELGRGMVFESSLRSLVRNDLGSMRRAQAFDIESLSGDKGEDRDGQ